MQITILICEHHNGRNVYACATLDRAWERLDQYVLEHWGSTRGRIASEPVAPTPGDPQTMTREQRIETFYDYFQSIGVREFHEIEDYDDRVDLCHPGIGVSEDGDAASSHARVHPHQTRAGWRPVGFLEHDLTILHGGIYPHNPTASKPHVTQARAY